MSIDHEVPEYLVLKLVSTLLKRNPACKGFKLKTKKGYKTMTFDEVVAFVDELADSMKRNEYIAVRRCDTCGNFSRAGVRGARGSCFPKHFTSFRHNDDFCSGWTPMSEEQKRLKEALNERFKIQTK